MTTSTRSLAASELEKPAREDEAIESKEGGKWKEGRDRPQMCSEMHSRSCLIAIGFGRGRWNMRRLFGAGLLKACLRDFFISVTAVSLNHDRVSVSVSAGHYVNMKDGVP